MFPIRDIIGRSPFYTPKFSRIRKPVPPPNRTSILHLYSTQTLGRTIQRRCHRFFSCFSGVSCPKPASCFRSVSCSHRSSSNCSSSHRSCSHSSFYHSSCQKMAVFNSRHYSINHNQTPFLHTFTDPNAYYPNTEITDKSVLAEMSNTTPAYRHWAIMAAELRTSPPRVGDFVEFRVGAEIRFGILLSPPPCLFNQFHNRSIVLTIHNELLRVCIQDYTFVCSQVLHEDFVPAAEVLQNRFDESFPARRRLVQYLHQFLVLVAEYRGKVDMRHVYSLVAGAETVSVSLHEVAGDVAEQLPIWEKSAETCRSSPLPSVLGQSQAQSQKKVQKKFQKKFHNKSQKKYPDSLHQNALLLALYLNMCANPADWIIPHCYDADRLSNVATHHSSNALPPPLCVLANSIALSMTLNDFMNLSKSELSHISTIISSRRLSSAKQSPSDAYDQLTLDLTIGEPLLRTAVDAIKYAVVFPHAGLTHQLSKIPEIGPNAGPRGLYTVLADLGLYDNPCNPLTDPILSSQVLGAVSPKTGVACSTRDLHPSHTFQVAKSEAKKFEDHFRHLRAATRASGTQKIYIVPGSHGTLGFSLEQLNTRRHLLNIHVPDLATSLAPASETFKAWAQNAGQSGQRAFPDEIRDYMQFAAADPGMPGFVKVGDMQSDTSGPASQTCMTLTFEYHAPFEESMAEFSQLVKVTFDRVSVCRMAEFGADVFEQALTGKLEPSVFKKFRLFSHKSAAEPEPISDEAHYDLNFVYNMMRRHFEFRNRHSGLNVAPAKLHKSPRKKLSVVGDLVQTEVSIEAESEKCGFLRRELEIFAGRMASGVADRLGVPVIRRRQRLVFSEPRPANDEVLICHDNSLLPDFTSNSYFQAAYARDVTGCVSMQAFIHASNFVGPEEITVSGDQEIAGQEITVNGDQEISVSGNQKIGTLDKAHVTLGVTGYASILPHSIEEYINQLQLLQAVHFNSLGQTGLYHKSRDFVHLKALGYNLHGPSDITLLGKHGETLQAAVQGWRYLHDKQQRYWKLKAVEMDPGRYTQMKCTVSRVSRDIDMQDANSFPCGHFPPAPVHVFCEDLGIEALMVTEPEPKMTLGMAKLASVYHVDAIEGVLILA